MLCTEYSLPMDLSSLEGPPVHNPRLTDPASNMSIPQIHFDHTFLASNGIEPFLLQRAASADADALRRTRYHNPTCIRNTARPCLRVQAGQSVDLDSTVRTSPSHGHRHSQSHSHRNAHSYRHSNSNLSSFSSAQTRPRRLTWIESESIWVVTSPSTGPPTVSSTWGDVNWSAAAYRPPPLQHSRSMDMTLAREAELEPKPEDLPPPYERHYFDRPLPLLLSEAEMDPSVGGSAYGQSTSLDSGHGHNHSQTRPSRWTEIGRRLNRSPFG